MTITKFRAFLATVECGSFTEAAKRLYYTQSAVWYLTLRASGVLRY